MITLGFGPQKYFDQAETLARSMRLHMPGVPLAIVTDREDPGPNFDIAIPLVPERGMGVIQKIWLDEYSPFEETLFIDSDCIVVRPFEEHLAALREYSFTPTCDVYLGQEDEDSFYFEDLGETMRTLGIDRFPKFNGGLLFFRKCELTSRIFQRARALAKRHQELRLIAFDGGGVADETLIGLALAEEGITDLYDCGGSLMRTPIGLSGPLEVDALSGTCRFTKHGTVVSPAICHFAAPYAAYSQYRYNSFLMRHPDASSWLKRLAKLYYRAETRLSGAYR